MPSHSPQPKASSPDASTVFIVEDEETVRRLLRAILRSAGFTTLESADGDDALRQTPKHAGHIDLVVADIGAVRLADFRSRLEAIRPGVRILFISGQSRENLLASGSVEPSTPLLEKPFGVTALLERVTKLIGDAPSE